MTSHETWVLLRANNHPLGIFHPNIYPDRELCDSLVDRGYMRKVRYMVPNAADVWAYEITDKGRAVV